MKATKLMVTQGLKCPPDVGAQITMESRTPKAYAKPICSKAVDH